MRLQIILSFLLTLSAAPALAHMTGDEAPQGQSIESHAVEETPDSADSGDGPLENIGKELDKALNQTIKVISDSALEFRVKNHLHNHNMVNWREIIVKAKNGEVTLEGEVESESESKKAEEIAKSTDGVNSVINKLKFKPSEESVNL